jgi:hypothetical protein
MKETLIFTAIIGGLAGGIAGLFGTNFFDSVGMGALAGAAVGFLFGLMPRNDDDARVAVEGFSPAGFIGGITGAVVGNAGWLGSILGAGAGWGLGLLVPAVFMVLFSRK